jgi:adenylylsulfate reductase subunit A
MAGEFGNPEVVEEEVDILLIGGGMACCGAAFEIMRWAEGTDLKIKLVDKAAMDRSGAVAQGLSAINTYIGTEQDPADYARMVSNDLMGITRDDLAYDLGRHVDESVHLFEEWGLPIWKTDENGERHDGSKGMTPLKDGGKPVRSGKWQIMINGESYKWIVAEAAKKAIGIDNIEERIFIVELVNDKNDPHRIAGAVGFSVRDHKVVVYKFKACLLAAGGCVNLFRPRSVGEGQGRAWYPVWNAGSTYAMAAQAGAELTMMENRFVPTRFKDGYGPVGAWFLLFKSKATNAFGEVYMDRNKDMLDDYPPYGHAAVPASCLRNHLMLKEMKEGRGPIYMDTVTALANLRETLSPREVKHLEAEAWEDFLDMTISQAILWAGLNVKPEEKHSEIAACEPYFIGSHSGASGAWVSGPEDIDTPYKWGYTNMTTVDGLFAVGDGSGASSHKFSSGSHAEGRIAGKAAIKYIVEKGQEPNVDAAQVEKLKAQIYSPFDLYEAHKGETTDPEINTNYIMPRQFLFRLQKLMDEYAGGVTSAFKTSKALLERGLELMNLLKEDSVKMAARDLHELTRLWENIQRMWIAESHIRTMLFREETRWPGYYFRSDTPKMDDENWKCFCNCRWDPSTGEWEMMKKDVWTMPGV